MAPRFGGVFVPLADGLLRSTPAASAKSVPGADTRSTRSSIRSAPIAMAIRSRRPISSTQIAVLTDGTSCPGTDRKSKIACAVYVLGNLVGGTLSHEIGHSLGLANPFSDGFTTRANAPNRLMDAGGDRSFLERAELQGRAPPVLRRRIQLPAADPAVIAPAPNVTRPTCFSGGRQRPTLSCPTPAPPARVARNVMTAREKSAASQTKRARCDGESAGYGCIRLR